jgi:hypothetical protein
VIGIGAELEWMLNPDWPVKAEYLLTTFAVTIIAGMSIPP